MRCLTEFEVKYSILLKGLGKGLLLRCSEGTIHLRMDCDENCHKHLGSTGITVHKCFGSICFG